MIVLTSLFGWFQNLVTLMVPICCLLTWFSFPSCSHLSFWLLVQSVSSLIFFFLLLLLLFSTIPNINKTGSLDTILVTNLVTTFIVLMIIIGLSIGWTVLGSFLFVFAWSGSILLCSEEEGRLVINGSFILCCFDHSFSGCLDCWQLFCVSWYCNSPQNVCCHQQVG